MDIAKRTEENRIIISLSGRLDTSTAPELENEINASVENANELVLDFSGVEYISSAGLRVLLSAQKLMNKQNGSMIIKNPGSQITDVFEITGFNEILTVK